ncbi:uncharacterized protein LOC125673837 [Ostrea edulis]|uniref:uncharacterized protein LOC125673837 n=1 Tax=Ostrea edulis TaxID=37623 RepID=UPI002094D57D|nr:uncharacterized protein LOC125673837 [Ostrea edulis]
MESYLVILTTFLNFTHVILANPYSLLTGNNSGNIEGLGNMSFIKDADILRQILNQESLVRFSFVQHLQTLMMDMQTCKNNYDTLRKELIDLRKEHQRALDKNSQREEKVAGLKTTMSVLFSSVENLMKGRQTIKEQQKLAEGKHQLLLEIVNNTIVAFNADLIETKERIRNMSLSLSILKKYNSISFSVLMSSAKTYSPGQTWIFDTVLVNEGNHFNASCGTFTAPSGGTYVFAWATLTNPGKAAHPSLRINGVYKGWTAFNQISSTQQIYSSGSNQVVLTLQEGDQVNIASSYLEAFAREKFSSFSGWKLY